MKYRISADGVAMIASFEGYVPHVYADSRGLATVGFGHLLHMSAPTAADRRAYDGKPRQFYVDLLHDDIERVSMMPMRSQIHVALNQNHVNALASLTFNCGGGALAGTIGRKLNAGDYRGAADAFMLWSHPPELTPRRRQERALFLTPMRAGPLPWLTDAERRWCLELDRLKRTHHYPARQRVLRRVMLGEAAKIQHAARYEGGWDTAHRRQRYHSLMARVA